jgi:hypothetical protein
MRDKPVPPPIVEEEPFLATVIEEPPLASVVVEPSRKKSIWTFWPFLVGVTVLVWGVTMFVLLLFGQSIPNSGTSTSRTNSGTSISIPNSGTSTSSGSYSRLISPDTNQWLAVNTEAHWGPSENAGVVGKMNRGAVVTVAKDDGSGWVEVYGFAAAIYKSNSWIRYPNKFLDIRQNVFVRKKHLTPSHPGF